MHGSNATYVKGCRCAQCKAAHALYQRTYRSYSRTKVTVRHTLNRGEVRRVKP